jgi:hypothetical protein
VCLQLTRQVGLSPAGPRPRADAAKAGCFCGIQCSDLRIALYRFIGPEVWAGHPRCQLLGTPGLV